MNYHTIKTCDQNNGDGLRVTLFVSGCEHHCPECQNPQTWDKDSGAVFDEAEIVEIGNELDKDYVSGITFSGGDPLAPYNKATVLRIVNWVKRHYPEKNIWLYTGYEFETLMFAGSQTLFHIIRQCDVIVDGAYMKDLRDTSLKWRGSSNQRVIDVQKSLQAGNIVLWCD